MWGRKSQRESVRAVMKLPSHFYAMIDAAFGHEPVALAATMLDAGARVLQLRLKDLPARDFLAGGGAIAGLWRVRCGGLIVKERRDIAMLAGEARGRLRGEVLPLDWAAGVAVAGEVIRD